MKKVLLFGATLVALVSATPATAQFGGGITVEPYAGYGFFGGIPDQDVTIDPDVTFGGRVGYRFHPQWAAFGNFQRSTPSVSDDDTGVDLGGITVDHWSAGVEFSYIPRGGAEGMLPILLEAGIGQARYDTGTSDFSDFAVNIGIASAIEFTDRFLLRYGANDYISNYGDDEGIVNHIFVRIGAEIRL